MEVNKNTKIYGIVITHLPEPGKGTGWYQDGSLLMEQFFHAGQHEEMVKKAQELSSRYGHARVVEIKVGHSDIEFMRGQQYQEDIF